MHPQSGNGALEGDRKDLFDGRSFTIGHVEFTRGAETLTFDYGRSGRVAVRVARIFNTYGPNMDPDDGRVVSNLICQALRGEPLTVYGDGSQTRSFCYVSDMVDGLMALMEGKAADG